jgi:hypothetical protein
MKDQEHTTAPVTWNTGCEENPTPAAVRENMRTRFAIYPTGREKEQVVDMVTGARYSLGGFGLMYKSLMAVDETSDKQISAFTLFMSDPAKSVLDGLTFRPGDERRLISEDGELRFNTWMPRRASVAVSDEQIEHAGELFYRFLEGLITDRDEVDYVVNWIARKVQCPAERGVSMVFASETKGTGKGALFKLIEQLVGEKYTTAKKMQDLLGTSAAAQYFADLQHMLLVLVHEAMTAGKDRVKGAENVKTYISPMPERVPLNPKGVDAFSDWVFFSVLIASNNPEDAIPIDDSDRRFTIIRTAEVPLIHNHDAKAALDELMPENRLGGDHDKAKAMIEALYQYLMSLETDGAMFRKVLDNEARSEAIDAGEGELEHAAEKVLHGLVARQRGILMDDLVSKVVAVLPGSRRDDKTQMVRKVLTKKLKQRHMTQEGRKVRGFAGWVHPGKKAVTPPDGVTWEPMPGLTSYVSERGDARWQCRSLVVQAQFEDVSTKVRGAILDEAMNKDRGPQNLEEVKRRNGLRAIEGGRGRGGDRAEEAEE